MTRLLSGFLTVLVFLSGTVSHADPVEAGYFRHHMFDGGWHAPWYGPIGMLIFVGLILAAFVLVARWISGRRG